MRVSAFTAGILLTSAIVSVSSLTIQPAMAAGHKGTVTCLCDCPDDHKVKAQAVVKPAAPVRRVVRRAPRRHFAEGSHYSYGMAQPMIEARSDWHGGWQVAPNDAFIPGPAPMATPPVAYYPPPAPPPAEYGMRIDERGFNGGVGDGGDGGGGGGGYGQVHLASGGSVENGPTYNSYDQSFQYNPSQAGPFQNRLMGGFAPPPAKK